MDVSSASRMISPTVFHVREITIVYQANASSVQPIVIHVFQRLVVHLARVGSHLLRINVSEIVSSLALLVSMGTLLDVRHVMEATY